MLRDVFYFGEKPNVHPRERHAKDLDDARQQANTYHFWIINELCDYSKFEWDFDFDFLPDEDVWAEDHNNIWPSQHQKDSGTWLCPKEENQIRIYRSDVTPVPRISEPNSYWSFLDKVDKDKFDFSWHPDPTEPPYIYKWGSKFASADQKPALEYHTPGNTGIVKHVDYAVDLLPLNENWRHKEQIKEGTFDFTWRPPVLDTEPFIYAWGSKWADVQQVSVLEYHVPGNNGTVKYMDGDVELEADMSKWEIVEEVELDSFDFTWRPDPLETEPFIYVFGNHLYEGAIMPTLRYTVEGATDIKYIDEYKPKLIQNPDLFEHYEETDRTQFDYSWRPNPTAPAYRYAWGNQWNDPQDKVSVAYIVEGATEYEYMEERTVRLKHFDNWNIPDNLDITDFDFSWEPSPNEPAMIHEFATQWQKTGGPTYTVAGATEVKYEDVTKAKALAFSDAKWEIPSNIDVTDFDFSWHPDATEPVPYVYQFPTQWARTGGPVYRIENAEEVKYVDSQQAKALPCRDNWEYDSKVIDEDSFDFSWHPYAEDEPFIYQFGTQHQKTGGPKYVTPGVHGGSAVYYIDTRILASKRLPNKNIFTVLNDYIVEDFDYSWHPDDTAEPFIYQFGNQYYPAEEMPTIQYRVIGADTVSYVDKVVAKLGQDKSNWEIPENIDVSEFDFSWLPDPGAPPMIHEFGTQWQKTGGPRYLVEGATEVNYVDQFKAKALPNKSDKWTVPSNIDAEAFDFSWHPDATSPAYIYNFATQWALGGGPIYTVEGAEETKYIDDQTAKAIIDKSNWKYDPKLIDEDSFDFSWHPYVEDQPYIYHFATQHQKTGGPVYMTPGVHEGSQIKYVDARILKAKRLSNPNVFTVLGDVKIKDFDYSWHPDDSSEPFIYQFGNQHYPAEEMPTVQYRVIGAENEDISYVSDIIATLDTNKSKWEIPKNIDCAGFDFSWVPHPGDPDMIHEFGTQHQKTGGPRYIVEGATETKYDESMTVTALATNTDIKSKWSVPDNLSIDGFDFSWHPDATEPVAYIYQFGTQWALTGGPKYTEDDAEEVKYMEEQTAKALPCRDNWEFDKLLIDVDAFDFSWHPYIEDRPYIYQFGTQWQKTGGPRYVAPGADEESPIKYIDPRILKSKRLAKPKLFTILNDYKIKDFDFSWHPDETAEPFIYQFGNQFYPAEEMPTIQFRVIGAENDAIAYVSDIVATLGRDKRNWKVPTFLDVENFDFSWKPNPNEPAMIHEFGTQHQKTGGPKYHVEGATEVKHEDYAKAVALPNMRNWEVPTYIDQETFDFSWHPDANSPPYIYRFPTQWALSGGPVYICEKATEVKYIEEQTAKALPNKEHWVFDPKLVDEDDFDYSWHPYIEDDPFIYQFGTQHQKTGGHKYVGPGVEEDTATKYIDPRILKSKRLPNPNSACWKTLNMYEIKDFDYSWHHDETEDAFKYQFGNKYYPAEEMPTIEYTVPGGSEVKYINDVVAELEQSKDGWEIPDDVDVTHFDFSWKPSPLENVPYIYQFGTQWQKTGGPKYVVTGATEMKYIDVTKARKLPNKKNWDIPTNVTTEGFDFSWHPDDLSGPYIYQFGTQWAMTGGPRYVVKGGIEVKYVESPLATILPSKENWEYDPKLIDEDSFDFSWHPYAEDDPFIYQFGTQHQKTGGPKYVVEGATKTKYVDPRVLKATRLANKKEWTIPSNVDVSTFDFSWHPDELAPAVIYQFGTLEDDKAGPMYQTIDNNGEFVHLERIEREIEEVVEEAVVNYPRYYIETTLEDLVDQHKDEMFWALTKGLEYEDFDFTWKPSIEQVKYVHAWGSSSSTATQTYFINGKMWHQGNRDINWVEDLELDDKTLAKMFEKPDMFYVDRGNKESKERFEVIQKRYPNIQKTRYLNSWADTIKRATNRSTTELLWVLNSELDYAEFDFEYYPNPWQMKMVSIFGTQWSHWGTTYLVNRESFVEDTKFIKVVEHLNNLNFVKHIRAKATECVYDVVVVDHGNKETEGVVNQLQEKAPRQRVSTVKHDTDYFVTLKNIVAKLPTRKEHYVWIASSICDYGDFDLSYICDPFARDQLHVFPSSKQKFGDTFFIDVNKTREIIDDMESLDDYEKINYNQTLRTQRLSPPVFVTEGDSHTETVKQVDNFPYAVLVSESDKDIEVVEEEPMSLWSAESKNIIVQSTGGTRIIVPTEVKDQVQRELYEYPYIKNANRLALSKPMDIVFLSNGETGAEANWEHLQKITKNIPNRVVRVDGVDGRVQAYHASAEASETPWAFTVFAKLKVSPKFDFNWQPDRMQQPKHYIFEAKNPVNGLVYGHQAMIAYNKKLTLDNYGYGLDFTLDDEHASVPLISGIAQYNTDEFSTWRTAFREVIKLLVDDTEISKTRLEAWLNEADPKQPFFQESIKGAICGEEYFDEVDGDFEKLRLSYEWEWLKERYEEVSY